MSLHRGERVPGSTSVCGLGGVSSEITIGTNGVISVSRMSSISQQRFRDATRTFYEIQISRLYVSAEPVHERAFDLGVR